MKFRMKVWDDDGRLTFEAKDESINDMQRKINKWLKKFQ